MKKAPAIGRFVDEEEKALAAVTEKPCFSPGPDALSPARLKQLQAMARAAINEERAKISLRLPKRDLARRKARALREGMPYQTLINLILRKAASGQA